MGKVCLMMLMYLCVTDVDPHILPSQTLDSFRYHLKIYYFQSAYPAP